MIIALLDSKLEGLGAELLPLVDLICPLLSVNHAESVSSKCPTVHVIQAQHVVRSCGGTLLLVAVNIEVVVIWTVPNQAADGTSVSVEREENWLVCGEELGELLVGESLVVLGSVLDLEQVNNVDEAGLDAQLAKHVKGSKELLSWDVAAGRENNVLLASLSVGSPLPLLSTSCKLLTSLVESYPRWSRLLTSEDCVDAVCGGVALLANCKQEVSVCWEVNVGDVVVVEALVEHDVNKTRILVRESVVVLAPNVAGKDQVESGDRLAPWDVANGSLEPLSVLVNHGVNDVNE